MADKKDSGKWDKRMFVLAVLGLVVGLVTSSYGFILIHEANVIGQRNLDLQNMLSNFTSIIVPNPQQGHLDEDGYYSNGTTNPTISRGWLNGSITVITSHYGNLTVEILNFSVNDYFNMLIPEKTNLTTVDYTNEYRYGTHVNFIVLGLNQLTFAVNLEATLYPNPQKLPSMSGSYSDFPIGVLFLKVKLFEPQINATTTQVFSSIVFVTVRIL
jgi:hypothetical protein